MKHTPRLGLVALTTACALASCRQVQPKAAHKNARDAALDATFAGNVTYHKDVKPIIDTKCVGCHTTGGGAPFPLTTYAEVLPKAASIKASTAARTMPPWLASGDCNEYKFDNSLSDAEIALISRWVDAGAGEGEALPDATPAQPIKPSLTRVDATLKMPRPFTPDVKPDEYRCFVLDWTTDETVYVTAFGAKPGNAAIAHHAIAFLVGPEAESQLKVLEAEDDKDGYTCFGGPRTLGFPSWVGAWAPGISGMDYPEGTGLKIAPGSRIVLQMHYNTEHSSHGLHSHHNLMAGDSDQTSIELRFEKRVAKEAYILPWANLAWVNQPETMKIPSGKASVVHSYAADPTPLLGGKGFDLHMAMLHMHNLGKAGLMILETEKRDNDQCLLDIPRWNFAWQFAYWLKTPVRIEPGMKLGIECEWDNSAEAQPLMNGKKKDPIDVTWGEGTNDEMCLGVAFVTLAE